MTNVKVVQQTNQPTNKQTEQKQYVPDIATGEIIIIKINQNYCKTREPCLWKISLL